MLAFYGSRVSPHMTETPEGFLICHDVPIARTGRQDYLNRELGGQGDRMVPVIREEAEVFSTAAMASFEGKPVTDDHPPMAVTSENSSMYAKGHVQNVHRGSGSDSDLLLADLFITDAELIRAIQNGLREVSCGYECDYEEDDRGHVYQRRIRGNHVAVVAAGRAGSRVSIKDSIPRVKGATKVSNKNVNPSIVARLFAKWAADAEPDEVAEAVDSLIEEEPETDAIPAQNAPEQQTPVTVTNQDTDECGTAELVPLLKQLLAKLTGGSGADAVPQDEPDPLKQLEDALEGVDPTAPKPGSDADTLAEQEASQTVPAEELNDADPAEVPQVQPLPGADSAATLAAIRAMKPYLAKLPDKDRRMASDSIARAVRQARGMTAAPVADGYAALLRAQTMNARKRASDSKPVSDALYGQNCAKRNPHNK